MVDETLPIDAMIKRAIATLEIEASPEAKAKLEERLRTIAPLLALEWITGERRFENLSQHTEYWLARLFEELYPDEQPDATKLYLRFSLPLPRAQYVARLLLARRSSHWRISAHDEMVRALKSHEAAAKEAADVDKETAQSVRFDVSMSRGAYDELTVLYDRLVGGIADQSRPAPPRRGTGTSGKLVWCSLTAECLLGLLKLLEPSSKTA